MGSVANRKMRRRSIGAGLLCVGSLCIIFGDQSNSSGVVQFGKAKVAVGVAYYFSGRVGEWWI